jgi:phospholipase C
MKSITGGLVFGLVALLTACRGLPVGGVVQGPKSFPQVTHIVWMLQENRSFDNYFGKLNDYRQAHGLSAEVDGIPANASNPSADGTTQIQPFHLNTVCIENVTPSWNESRIDVNRFSPNMQTGPMNGFVYSAAHYAVDENLAGRGPYVDTAGVRAMGYYTERELPYYYFMATQFATSDRFFSAILSRTPSNRIANLAASALGVVDNIPVGASFEGQRTIFHLLQATGISWKIYETSGNTYLGYFGAFLAENQAAHVAPISQYFTDLANGTLPEVAFIETGVEVLDTGGTNSLDEHPDANIQDGAAFVAKIVNALMQSTSWSSSVFILTYDEAGGLYDHVPPQPAVIPDAIPPQLGPNIIVDDYSRTGMRVPLLVISPFTKKGYVSHTVMDSTAILKFIETRFGLPSLTARDAAQPDMSEFFDFQGSPNSTPPTPPAQPVNAPCTVQTLP